MMSPKESRKHYSVPDGYIEELPDKIMDFIRAQDAPAQMPAAQPRQEDAPKTPRWRLLFNTALYMAASFVLVIVMFQGFNLARKKIAAVQEVPTGQMQATLTPAQEDELYSTYFYEELERTAKQEETNQLEASFAQVSYYGE